MTADDVKRLLRLEPHPREGGWFRQTYAAEERIAAEAFENSPYPSARRVHTAIYYLLEPGTFSEMHRLRSDEVFHHYAGAPVEMLQLHPDGRGETIVIGPDLLAGQAAAGAGSRGTCGKVHGCLPGARTAGRCWDVPSRRVSSMKTTTPAHGLSCWPSGRSGVT